MLEILYNLQNDVHTHCSYCLLKNGRVWHSPPFGLIHPCLGIFHQIRLWTDPNVRISYWPLLRLYSPLDFCSNCHSRYRLFWVKWSRIAQKRLYLGLNCPNSLKNLGIRGFLLLIQAPCF